MPDYQQGKIYKIEPICDHEEHEIYIGSTTEKYLSDRLSGHRRTYKTNQKKNITVYNLFDKYGAENCNIYLIENFSCDSKNELNTKEGEYIRKIKCINKRIEGRTDQQYREDNKEQKKIINKQYRENNKEIIKEQKKEYYMKNIDKIKEAKKEYYEKNKEIIHEKAQVKLTCECGCSIRKDGMTKHQRSKKHINLMNNKENIK